MERFWCLRWLSQENAKHVDAVVLKDEVLRLVDIPLIIKSPGMPQLARGTQVKLDLIRWDEVDLTVEARLLEVETTSTAADEEITTTESETDAESIPE
jgi:exoribonuclease-2